MHFLHYLGRFLGSLLQGSDPALQAYTRASDAYAADLLEPSVALWSVGIGADLVLLEWAMARRRRRP